MKKYIYPDYQRPTTVSNCTVCHKQFSADAWNYKKGKRRTCSLSCAGKLARIKNDQRGSKNPSWKGGIPLSVRIKKYTLKYPLKAKARKAVTLAIKAGRLNRSICEDQNCTNQKTDAHHDDYSKPLSVRWLCRRHHTQWHRFNKSLFSEANRDL